MRIAQPTGAKGSLKWIQKSITCDHENWLPVSLQGTEWVSPLPDDDWSEYRDASLLLRVQQEWLGNELLEFWPTRGPQWDALGIKDGVPVLVEAKAHIREFFSPSTQASADSRDKIERTFREVVPAFGSNCPERWSELYFQYANRLAHLWFFHSHGVKAHLLFISYLNDYEMGGPTSAETWRAAFEAADYAIGIKRNSLSARYVHHSMPSVDAL